MCLISTFKILCSKSLSKIVYNEQESHILRKHLQFSEKDELSIKRYLIPPYANKVISLCALKAIALEKCIKRFYNISSCFFN